MTTWKLAEGTYSVSIKHKFDHEENLVSEEITEEKLVASYDVTDAPNLRVSGYSTVVIRPDRAVVTFKGDRFRDVKVCGNRVLKSGATGATRHDHWAPWERDNWPDWLRNLVEKAEQEMKDA